MKTELFDRYVYQVGRRLPKNQRADVEAELHSLLMDALQDRLDSGEEPDEADQAAVLEAFGPPEEVAARYAPPHRYLIGPVVFDIYALVAGIAAGGLTIAYIVLLALATWGEPRSEFGSTLIGLFGSYLGALLSGFGSVTLTFAILERVVPAKAWAEQKEQAWDPRALPEIKRENEIERGRLIVSSVLLVLALIVFNVFPSWIGVGFVGSIDGGPVRWHSRPILSPYFFAAYLPWLNALWLVTLAFNVVLLRQGRWQRWTRAIDLAVHVGGLVLVSVMVFGPSIITTVSIQSEGVQELLDTLLPNAVRLALIVALIATTGETIHKLYLLVRGESKYTPPQPGEVVEG